MKTVIILAEALSKAAFSPIVRLDIQLVKNGDEDYYKGWLWLADEDKNTCYCIKEDGTITKGTT